LSEYLVGAKLERRKTIFESGYDRWAVSSLLGNLLISLLLQVPARLGQTFLALMSLRLIMNDIAGKAFRGNGGKHSLSLEQASRYHVMLTEWVHDLPGPLQAHNVAIPVQLLLQ
jgi:hypothetical protein